MDLALLLWNSLIACLAVVLISFLACFFRRSLFLLLVVGTGAALLHFANLTDRTPSDTMAFIKFMLLVPFGLGSLLAFSLLSTKHQARTMTWFAPYINLAVTCNIFVMVFTPSGDSFRGILSRLLCCLILLSLLKEMAKIKFQTVQYEDGIFLFRSSPLGWILAHAGYRMALLSLPAFESLHYVLLEPLSLLTMTALYYWHQKRYPLSYYFGFADTLVVTTLVLLARYPIPLPGLLDAPSWGGPRLSEAELDRLFIPIQLAVLTYVVWSLVRGGKTLSDRQLFRSKKSVLS